MPTLYVSDLDGTLLGPDACISPETADTLNRLIDRGMLFTVATARTPATVVELLESVHLKIPAVLMTGTLLYDLGRRRALATTHFPPEVARTVCEAFQAEGREALLYTVKNGQLDVYYRQLDGDFERAFVEQRCNSPYKTFRQTENYVESVEGSDLLLALLCLENEPDARRWYKTLAALPGVFCYLYPNQYGSGFTVEAFPAGCNKASGLDAVKAMTGADRVVCFGDSLNDLPMFEHCDESCAMENALPALKEHATRVIGSNADSGVARWLAQNAEI